jgi:SAM-dependent methyltransferase
VLALGPGARVLDVGCGPGRHAHALARRGLRVVGVDVAARFVALAAAAGVAGAAFVRADARALPVAPGAFDAVVSLCQGGFGLLGGVGEEAVVAGMAAALRPGGRLALSACCAYFAVRHLEAGEDFDAATGVLHERTDVRDEAGVPATFDLWTTCYTPRELRLLAAGAGLDVEGIWSVAPGDYRARPPSLAFPELLLVARRPPGPGGS